MSGQKSTEMGQRNRKLLQFGPISIKVYGKPKIDFYGSWIRPTQREFSTFQVRTEALQNHLLIVRTRFWFQRRDWEGFKQCWNPHPEVQRGKWKGAQTIPSEKASKVAESAVYTSLLCAPTQICTWVVSIKPNSIRYSPAEVQGSCLQRKSRSFIFNTASSPGFVPPRPCLSLSLFFSGSLRATKYKPHFCDSMPPPASWGLIHGVLLFFQTSHLCKFLFLFFCAGFVGYDWMYQETDPQTVCVTLISVSLGGIFEEHSELVSQGAEVIESLVEKKLLAKTTREIFGTLYSSCFSILRHACMKDTIKKSQPTSNPQPVGIITTATPQQHKEKTLKATSKKLVSGFVLLFSYFQTQAHKSLRPQAFKHHKTSRNSLVASYIVALTLAVTRATVSGCKQHGIKRYITGCSWNPPSLPSTSRSSQVPLRLDLAAAKRGQPSALCHAAQGDQLQPAEHAGVFLTSWHF